MVQHIFLVPNGLPPTPPIAQPGNASIYRDDQNLSWKILANGWQWGPAPAIVFASGWKGSQPQPIGTVPIGEPDLRLYTAVGPGPNFGTEPEVFEYTIALSPITENGPLLNIQGLRLDYIAEKMIATVTIVDPDISNQPQP